MDCSRRLEIDLAIKTKKMKLQQWIADDQDTSFIIGHSWWKKNIIT